MSESKWREVRWCARIMCLRARPQPAGQIQKLKGELVFCRKCGKEIEAGARFCRFCGASQQETPGGSRGSRAAASPMVRFERWLRHVFPRHHLQDQFMHAASIAAALFALLGFIIALLGYPYGEPWILFSIALLLFLMLRESTLARLRSDVGHRPGHDAGSPSRYHSARPSAAQEADKPETAGADPRTPSRPN